MNYQFVLFAFVLLTSSLEVFGQASWASVRICGVVCSDNNTYAQCCDLFGAIQSGDCMWAQQMGYLQCPSPYQPISYPFDLGANRDLAFTNVDDCQRVFDSWKTSPNLPVIVGDSVVPPITRNQNPIREAFEWHDDFSKYSLEEQLELGKRIIEGNNKTRSQAYSDEEVRDIARTMFGFVQSIREKTEKTGVYTNSKCAGCSLIVQSIQERLTSSACDKITSVLKGAVCGSNPVFELFCNAIVEFTEVDKIVESICLDAFNGVIGATGIRDRANLICSSLTCTSQPSQVTSENDIQGCCSAVTDSNNVRTLNERCDQLIRICDMAEKGLCISDTLDEIKEFVDDGFVKAGLNTILSLVKGDLPPAVDTAKKAAQCSKVKCGYVFSDSNGDSNNDSNNDSNGEYNDTNASRIILDDDSASHSAPVLFASLVMVFVLFFSHF